MTDAVVKEAGRETEKGGWSEIFRSGLRLYPTLVIGGIAMQATQMLVIAIIMADHRHRYRWCRLLHLGGDALHDRHHRWRRIDRNDLGMAWRTPQLRWGR